MELNLLIIIPSSILIFVSLVFYLGYRKFARKTDPRPKEFPFISVIIPVLNEINTVEGTIDSINIAKKKYAGKVEIIAVDDGSSDGTYELLKRIRKTKGIRVYQNIVKSKGLNVNYGVSKSKGEFIGVIDADTFIAPNIFNKMIGYFANPKVGSVFANIVPRNTRKLIEKYQEIEYTYVSFVRQAMAAIETMYVTPGGGFPLYRKRVFEQVGGYCGPEILTEDFEMGVKLIKAGYIIKVTRDAKTFTNVPSTFMRLFKQRVRWYRGTLQTYKKHRDMLFNTKYPFVSFFILPLFFVLTTIIFVIYLNVGLGLVDSLSLGYNQVSTMLELGYLPSLNFNFLNLNVLFLFSHLTIFLTINFVIWLLAFKEGLRISGKSLRFNIILGIIVTILYGPITLLFYVKAFYDEFRAKPNKWW